MLVKLFYEEKYVLRQVPSLKILLNKVDIRLSHLFMIRVKTGSWRKPESTTLALTSNHFITHEKF